MRAISLRISGRVQGVFFRASTCEKAQSLGIRGWCKNDPDGSVLVFAQGEEPALTELINWCHQGPIMASVTKVEVEEVSIENLSDFSIRR